MTDRDETNDQILSVLYQLKMQGVESISSGELMMLMGIDEEEIPSDQFNIVLRLTEDNEIQGELALARLMNRIH